MFNEILKQARKKKGFSQAELAERLHVVRQTISKWENGTAVPDATMLVQLAEELDVPVSVLLGKASGESSKVESEINDIAERLSEINEQLAKTNRRSKKVWKIIGIIILMTFIIALIIMMLNFSSGVPIVS